MRSLRRIDIGVPVLAGLITGAQIGLIAVTLHYVQVASDCGRSGVLHSRDACDAIPSCQWSLANEWCAFRGDPDDHGWRCDLVNETDRCAQSFQCEWNSNKGCQHRPGGWSPTQQGLFAGSSIGGGALTVLSAGITIPHLFRNCLRRTLLGANAVALAGALLSIVAWMVNSNEELGTFWLLIVARVILGAGVGLHVASGALAGAALAPGDDRSTGPLLFNPAMAGCNALTAMLAVPLNPAWVPAAQVQGWYVVLNVYQVVLPCVLTAVLLLKVKAPLFPLEDDEAAMAKHTPHPDDEAAAAFAVNGSTNSASKLLPVKSSESTSATAASMVVVGGDDEDTVLAQLGFPSNAPRTFAGRLAVGVLLGTVLQFTGISAVVAFAPKMIASAGVPVLPGYAVLMLWNALTALGALCMAARFQHRMMFLVSATACCIACLATGIPTLAAAGYIDSHSSDPDADQSAMVKGMDALVLVGIFAVMAAYELGMGPAFYVLSQSVFKPSERKWGNMMTIGSAYSWTLVINFAYAPAQSELSGNGSKGSSGLERRGQGILFLVFGGVGLLMTAGLYRWLRPSRLNDAEASSS